MTQKALIDADLIAFRCAATCEEFDTPEIAIQRCNSLTEHILLNTGASSYTLYLTGSTNFRKEINPEYKANRKDKPRPKWLEACREFLVTNWNAQVTDGIEADDAMGINQTESTIICSLDKDMLQVPGWHYNWVKDKATFVTPSEGIKSFWMQMIVGDTADNIFGIRGLGPVKAGKFLLGIEEDGYYDRIRALYEDDDRLHMNAKCLWILRKENGIWLTPEEHEKEIMESTEVSSKQTSLNSLPPID